MNELQRFKDLIGDAQNQIDEIKAEGATEWRDDKGAYTEAAFAKLDELLQAQTGYQDKVKILEALGVQETEAAASYQSIKVLGPLNAKPLFANIAEYCRDIAISAKQISGGGTVLPNVAKYQEQVLAAATGAGEVVPSDGGYLVGTDFSNEILRKVYENNAVLSRSRTIPISAQSNRLEINGVDETSRATGSRWGGVRFYWLSEAETKTASKPTFRKIVFELNEGAVLIYATDTLLQDSTAFGAITAEAVAGEIDFAIQDSIINGSGAGQPLGILNSPALVSIAEEAGQADDTVVYENILKMWARKWGPGSRYVWLINGEITPQLGQMNMAVGTGGAPVYLPAGGASEAPFQTLMGRPLIEIEQAAGLGDVGDIILADLSQYIVAQKMGIQAAMSIHVEFLTNQTVFRWVIRIDGQPSWNSPLTPYKSTATFTKSPFVTIAAR